jgi:hypothetical protein
MPENMYPSPRTAGAYGRESWEFGQRNIVKVDERRTVIELRIAGRSTADIAQELQIPVKKVYAHIANYLEEHPPPGLEELRALLTERYELLWMQILPRLSASAPEDVQSALAILEGMRKLTGADMPQAPATVNHNVHVLPSEIPLRNKILQLEKDPT